MPTFDIESLQELTATPTSGNQWTASAPSVTDNRNVMRVGEAKKANPLEELRSVFRVVGGLKLSRGKTKNKHNSTTHAYTHAAFRCAQPHVFVQISPNGTCSRSPPTAIMLDGKGWAGQAFVCLCSSSLLTRGAGARWLARTTTFTTRNTKLCIRLIRPTCRS